MSDDTTSTVAPSAEPVQSATPAPEAGDTTQTTEPESAGTEAQKPATSDEGAEQKHTLPKGVQRRIDRLTRDKYRLQAELDMARKQAPQGEQQTKPAEGAPTPQQYKSYEEYLEARAEWRADQRLEARLGELRENAQRQAGQAEQEKLNQAWQKRVDEAIGAYDDFEEVALSPEVPISEPMMAAILRSPKGADVAYYLGKNTEVAAQIAGLDPTSAAIRIGEIAATISRPTAKKATGAPAPINPVGSRAEAKKDPDKMTTDEWMRWRNENAGFRRR